MTTTTTTGLGATEVLQLIFVVLKLVGSISWSWWWVLSPTLIPVGLVLGIALVWLAFSTPSAIARLLRRRADPNNVRSW